MKHTHMKSCKSDKCNYEESEIINNYRYQIKKLRFYRGDYLYQYRTLTGFWSIIKSDAIWATNARFSNDTQEQEIGLEIAKKNLYDNLDEETAKKAMRNLKMNDCYIICFCKENDLLSQWRGYAEDGVSIGFELRCVAPFSIVNKQPCSTQYKIIYEAVTEVDYIVTKIKDFTNLGLDPKKPEDFVKSVNKCMPYIKHHKFDEEKECRIVFQNDNHELKDYIRYREVDNLLIPYIIVKIGLKENKGNPIIRIPFFSGLPGDIKKDFANFCKRNKYIFIYPDAKTNYSDIECKGCNLYYTPNYTPSNEESDPNKNKLKCAYHSDKKENRRRILKSRTEYKTSDECFNEIYISANKKTEERVFNAIETFVKEKKLHNIKIWCEGHLPIRTITVGPIRNAKEVHESIIHYCKSIYWLRYVEVGISEIPYRKSLVQ